MKKKIKIALMMLALPFFQMAQTTNGSIKGKVIDENGEPLIGANAYLNIGESSRGATCDIDGNFHIREIPAGTYNLRISFIGYASVNLSKVEVTSDKITLLGNIQLGFSDTLDIVDIPYVEPILNVDNPTKISKTYKELKHSPNIRNAGALIQSFSPEIKMSEDGKELYFRGSRKNSTIYFVDGVKTESPSVIPGVAIGSMSVYTGGIPAKYGDTTGGVVIMETKSYYDLFWAWKGSQL